MRECFDVKNEKIKIWIVVYTKDQNEIKTIEDFWLNLLQISRSQLGKTKVIVSDKIVVKKNVHKYGGCSLYVGSTEIVQKIFGAIKNYAKIEKHDLWL